MTTPAESTPRSLRDELSGLDDLLSEVRSAVGSAIERCSLVWGTLDRTIGDVEATREFASIAASKADREPVLEIARGRADDARERITIAATRLNTLGETLGSARDTLTQGMRELDRAAGSSTGRSHDDTRRLAELQTRFGDLRGTVDDALRRLGEARSQIAAASDELGPVHRPASPIPTRVQLEELGFSSLGLVERARDEVTAVLDGARRAANGSSAVHAVLRAALDPTTPLSSTTPTAPPGSDERRRIAGPPGATRGLDSR